MIDFLATLEFRHPRLLLCGLVALPIVWASVRASGSVTYSALALLPARHHSWRAALAWLPPALLGVAALALAIGAAGPRTADQNQRVEREGIAIAMVIDISSSMRALDLDPSQDRTRLDVVKTVFERFVLGGGQLSGRPNDAIGLVSFARYADTRSPLTLDRSLLVDIAAKLEIVDRENEDGTALGDGLALALERLGQSEAQSKVAILLTDGVHNAGETSPAAAADVAAKLGIRVYTIGAGSEGFAPVKDVIGGREVLRRALVQIDEAMLKNIAERTGGQYFRATDEDGLVRVYENIDRLERTEMVQELETQYRELYAVPTAIGLGLAALAWLLSASVFRRWP